MLKVLSERALACRKQVPPTLQPYPAFSLHVAKDKQQKADGEPGRASHLLPPTSPPTHAYILAQAGKVPKILRARLLELPQLNFPGAAGLMATYCPDPNPFFMLLSFLHSREVLLAG